jgi:hypothetical protein
VDKTSFRGVYAQHPAGSPRFDTGNTLKAARTQARLYLVASSREEYLKLGKEEGLSDLAMEILEKITIFSTNPVTERDTTKQRAVVGDTKFSGGPGYIDFLLTGFSLQQSEQLQVVDVLSDAYAAYYFGQTAPRAQLSGIVLNTKQDNWYDRWQVIYQELLRGTMLAQRKLQALIRIDTRHYFGSIFNVSSQMNSQFETMANFSMGFLVKRISIKQSRNHVQISTDLRRQGLGARFSDVRAKREDALAVQRAKQEAKAQEKAVAISKARNILRGGITISAIDAEGDAVINDPISEMTTAGQDAVQQRESLSPDDLEQINKDAGSIEDQTLAPGYGPINSEPASTYSSEPTTEERFEAAEAERERLLGG